MKYLLNIFFTLILIDCGEVLGQELNIGLQTGMRGYKVFTEGTNMHILVGSITEYRPKGSFVSFNNELTLSKIEDDFVLFIPLYFMMNIDIKKFSFNPIAGYHLSTNSTFGGLMGLNMEYQLGNGYSIITVGRLIKNKRRCEFVFASGMTSPDVCKSNEFSFSLGITKSIKIN